MGLGTPNWPNTILFFNQRQIMRELAFRPDGEAKAYFLALNQRLSNARLTQLVRVHEVVEGITGDLQEPEPFFRIEPFASPHK